MTLKFWGAIQWGLLGNLGRDQSSFYYLSNAGKFVLLSDQNLEIISFDQGFWRGITPMLIEFSQTNLGRILIASDW